MSSNAEKLIIFHSMETVFLSFWNSFVVSHSWICFCICQLFFSFIFLYFSFYEWYEVGIKATFPKLIIVIFWHHLGISFAFPTDYHVLKPMWCFWLSLTYYLVQCYYNILLNVMEKIFQLYYFEMCFRIDNNDGILKLLSM